MSTKFYVKDINGTIPTSNGQGMFRLIQGKALDAFMNSNEFDEKYFYTLRNEYGDVIKIECSKEQYDQYEKERKHQHYLKKQVELYEAFEISFDIIVTQGDEQIEMIETISDENVDCEKEVERKQMIEALHKILESLKPEEYELIYNLYLAEEPISESQYSKNKGIPRKTINNRKLMILKKIKSFL